MSANADKNKRKKANIMKKINEIEELKMVTGGIGTICDKSDIPPFGYDRPPVGTMFPPCEAGAVDRRH